ncbi:enamine deaminase RidA (YjgF/YER057c/UK114 family) [Methylovorus glucosotrophus]|uniref:RidA family protein n=1 Tax=Methylovorus glucosotrophus TaxID=266009 RepID=UPI001331A899|nr:RidA family protein [Methylovorus glucosotrophus]KAF0836236.1 enamine deaminase RidA (YjgF/YER057c/UK114 family) [Methylovorus glucosotrophus]
MSDLQRLYPGARYSEATIFNGTIYLAGQVPNDGSLDIQDQTAEVLTMIDNLLAEAGSDKSRILMAQIFLADLADYDSMNKVWDAWVPAGAAPPRATVKAALARPEWRIEIVITAAQL